MRDTTERRNAVKLYALLRLNADRNRFFFYRFFIPRLISLVKLIKNIVCKYLLRYNCWKYRFQYLHESTLNENNFFSWEHFPICAFKNSVKVWQLWKFPPLCLNELEMTKNSGWSLTQIDIQYTKFTIVQLTKNDEPPTIEPSGKNPNCGLDQGCHLSISFYLGSYSDINNDDNVIKRLGTLKNCRERRNDLTDFLFFFNSRI